MIKLQALWELVQLGRLKGAAEMKVVVEMEGKKTRPGTWRVDEKLTGERELVLVVTERRKLWERGEEREREIQEAVREFAKCMVEHHHSVSDYGDAYVDAGVLMDEAEVWTAKKKERERKENDTEHVD